MPLFSYLLHPIFVPTFGAILFFWLTNLEFNFQMKWVILFQIITITILIPITLFFLLKTLGAIDSVMVPKTAQRKLPLLFQIILLLIVLQKSIAVSNLPALYYFFLGGLISTIIVFVLLFKLIKASIHLVGISSLTFFAIGLSIDYQNNCLYLLAFLFIMNGVLASSRLEMKAHTMKELLLGYLIGALPQIGLYYFWL